jgi:septal ring factor EnvC (AmiA/AmiB activator)
MDIVQMLGLFLVGAFAVLVCFKSKHMAEELREANAIIEKLTEDKRKLEDNLNFALNMLGERDRELTQLSNKLHGCQSCLNHTSKELEEAKSLLNLQHQRSKEVSLWASGLLEWMDNMPGWILDVAEKKKAE